MRLTLYLDSLIRLNPSAVRAHTVLLRRRCLHLERDRLRIAVRDGEGPLDELREGAYIHRKSMMCTSRRRVCKYRKQEVSIVRRRWNAKPLQRVRSREVHTYGGIPTGSWARVRPTCLGVYRLEVLSC